MSRIFNLTAAICACLIGLMGLLTGTAGAVSPRPSGTRVPAQQMVVTLFGPHTAVRFPRFNAPKVATVSARRPITGERTTLPVLATTTGAGGVTWVRVRLPGRPNGHSGWIDARRTQESELFWQLVINLGARRVTAYLNGTAQRSFSAVVGAPATPTPTGHFFVEETVVMPANDPGGPYALALSARSNVYRHFDGGPGQVAVHGRDLLGGTLGRAQSHGCVRLGTDAITWLIHRLSPGSPVTIIAG